MATVKRPGAAVAAAILAIVAGGFSTVVYFISMIGFFINEFLIVRFSITTMLCEISGLVGGILLLMNKKEGFSLTLAFAFIMGVVNIWNSFSQLVPGMSPTSMLIAFITITGGLLVPAVIIILLLTPRSRGFYAFSSTAKND